MRVPWYLMAKGKGGGGYKTASGPIVSVNDALAVPLRSLRVGIDPVQDLHGFDSPWPGGGGKNLLSTAGLTQGTPSDTAFSNATKRTFTIGTFVTNLTSNNYYQASRVTQASVADNTISVTSLAPAYALSIPTVGVVAVGETYTFSASRANGSISVSFYQDDGTFISNTVSGLTAPTFTVPSGTYYTLFHFQPTASDTQATFTDIMLNSGPTALSYAPYSNICPISGWSAVNVWVEPTYDPTANPTATIQLGQTVYGGTLDVTNGVLTVDRAMVDMGTISWYKTSSTSSTGGSVFAASLQDVGEGMKPRDRYTPNTMLSNIYGACSDSVWYIINMPDFSMFSNVSTLFVADSRYTDAISFKTAVSGVQLVYELATPITIPLTPTQISTLFGANNIWADTGDVAVEYLSAGGANPDLMKLAVAFMGRR